MTKLELLHRLKELEWAVFDPCGHYCPCCELMAHHSDATKRLYPHAKGCALDACINKIEMEVGSQEKILDLGDIEIVVRRRKRARGCCSRRE